MSRIAHLYRFSRRRADALITATVLACLVITYGAVQQQDEAAARRMAAEARQ